MAIKRDLTVDEFIGRWWDRHAAVVYEHRELVASIPLLVRWILPYLGDASIRSLSSDHITKHRASLEADGAPAATIDACIGILDEIPACAANWGLIAPVGAPAPASRRTGHTTDVIPFPGPSRDDTASGSA